MALPGLVFHRLDRACLAWRSNGRTADPLSWSAKYFSFCDIGHGHIAADLLCFPPTDIPQAMEGTMSMFYMAADRLATAFARKHIAPITFGQLEARKSDTRLDSTKWFWNGELCCNPWQRF
jgi:hypothetical protein